MKYMLIVAALTITLMTCFATPASAAPRVVVSIKPLHSLVSGVMKGVGEPYLLIKARSLAAYLFPQTLRRKRARTGARDFLGGRCARSGPGTSTRSSAEDGRRSSPWRSSRV